MKNKVCILLCLLIILSMFGGCGKKESDFNILDNPAVAGDPAQPENEDTKPDTEGDKGVFDVGPETTLISFPDDCMAFEYEGSIYYVDQDSNIRRASLDMSQEEIFWENECHSLGWYVDRLIFIGISSKGILYTNNYRIDLKTAEAYPMVDMNMDSERFYNADSLAGICGEWAYFTDDYMHCIYRCRFSDMLQCTDEYDNREFLSLENLELVTDSECWRLAFVDDYIVCIFKSEDGKVYISPADGQINFSLLMDGADELDDYTSEYLFLRNTATDASWLVSPGTGETREFSSQLVEGVEAYANIETIDGRPAFTVFQDTLQWKYLDGEDYSTWNYDPNNPVFDGEFAMSYDVVGDWVFVCGNTSLSPEEGYGVDFIFRLGSKDVNWILALMARE